MQFMDENPTWKRVESCKHCHVLHPVEREQSPGQAAPLVGPAPVDRPIRSTGPPGASATPEMFNSRDGSALQDVYGTGPELVSVIPLSKGRGRWRGGEGTAASGVTPSEVTVPSSPPQQHGQPSPAADGEDEL
ncbi:hypothetical protein [Streptomyces sp. NPDC018584]|uniref:hypothetical protein n=1 Tax=unclassified Streptomyces TaxID=2593676 RepID=UPI0037982EA9